mmetsp:Transcript_6857/g.25618  ORF Transcript_6857/g.25618 Transcript_6857/m.25618 type:complete len:92 (+) Transcript_6857:424-699(+)
MHNRCHIPNHTVFYTNWMHPECEGDTHLLKRFQKDLPTQHTSCTNWSFSEEPTSIFHIQIFFMFSEWAVFLIQVSLRFFAQSQLLQAAFSF